jgi:acetyl-CoA carboxylase biotin carboxyl carrier protein
MADDLKTRTAAVIESPMVGFFYDRPAPDDPPFVSVGSVVKPGTTVCIIETMRVFTDIPAGGAGTITEILVQNMEAVEYGQPLFRVETDNPEAFDPSLFESNQQTLWDQMRELRDQIPRRIGG